MRCELFDPKFPVKTSPLTLGGCNFQAFDRFYPIYSETDAPRGGLHLLSGHPKQWGPPAKTVSKPYLKYSDTSHFILQYLQGFLGSFCCLRRALHAKLYSGNCWSNEYRPLMFGGRVLTKL
jgi:hypothetical protein